MRYKTIFAGIILPFTSHMEYQVEGKKSLSYESY